MWRHLVLSMATLLMLSACDVDSKDDDDDGETPSQYDFEWRWVTDDTNVNSGFSDYPVGQDTFYELNAAWAALPHPLSGRGFRLTGNNHSDDLFMFVKRKITGLEANARYDVYFTLRIASNAGLGCVGAGGAPGEGVTLKVGLSATEPARVQNGNNWLMNIDKGNQTVGGADAATIGNLATVGSNCNNNPVWMFKTMSTKPTKFTVNADANGELWLLIGSDSGYESKSVFYITDIAVQADRI